MDGSGNVYVTGQSIDPSSGLDYLTIKYSSAGVALWTNRYNGSGNVTDQPMAIALDGSTNVFVTGVSSVSGSAYDYATIKYSNEGVALWTNFFGGSANGNDFAYSLAVDGIGNIYVVGNTTISGGTTDYATIKYSNNGLPLWTNRYNGSANSFDYGNYLALDGSGNVYVTGAANGTSSDCATIKYSSAGVPLWTNVFRGSGNSSDQGSGLAVDGSGNVYVTGFATGTGSGTDFLTIKYSTTGVPLWTNILNGVGNSSDAAASIVVDNSGNVYVAGYATGSGSGFDYVTIKYSGPTPLKFITTNSAFGFTNSQFILSLSGPLGSNTVISASTDFQTWIPLVTNPLTGGTLNFTDTVATNFINRFYRANLQ